MSASRRANYAVYDTPPIVSVVNSGLGEGLASQNRQVAKFRSLTAGTNVTFVSTPNEIIINSTGGGGGSIITGSTTTVGAVVSTMIMIPILTDTVRSIRVIISTGNVTDSLGSSHCIETVYRNVSGTVTQIDPPETTNTFTEYGVTAANFTLVISGTTVLINVLGLAAKTINWSAEARVVDASIV